MEVFFLFAKTIHELSHALTYLCACIYLTNAKDVNVKFETTTQANNIRWETGGMERKIQEVGSSILAGNFPDFFPVDSDNFPCFPAGYVRKSSEKIWEIPAGNTASMFQIFPVFSCKIRRQEQSTWERHIAYKMNLVIA